MRPGTPPRAARDTGRGEGRPRRAARTAFPPAPPRCVPGYRAAPIAASGSAAFVIPRGGLRSASSVRLVTGRESGGSAMCLQVGGTSSSVWHGQRNAVCVSVAIFHYEKCGCRQDTRLSLELLVR